MICRTGQLMEYIVHCILLHNTEIPKPRWGNLES